MTSENLREPLSPEEFKRMLGRVAKYIQDNHVKQRGEFMFLIIPKEGTPRLVTDDEMLKIINQAREIDGET